ncbi:odorant receptor 13a-like isoform X2 [Nomia melanderi]|uniref:odorant receptor 13a-like isoform X2 n=2 Tax=Nomia melanderi TaxID=2448451 RepID=UPI003FCE6E21
MLPAGFQPYPVQSATCTGVVTMHDRSRTLSKFCIRNRDHEDDVNYTLEMCRWLLKPLGVWTLIYRRSSGPQKALSVLLLLSCVSCLLFIMLPSANNIFFGEQDIDTKVKLLGPVSFCVFSMIKYGYLSAKGEILGRCVQHVERDWRTVERQDHRTIMLKQAAISRHLITICVVFLYTGGMSYHTVMQFLSKETRQRNVTVRPLTYPCFNFLDAQSSPTYEIVFFFHCAAAMVMQTITTAAYSLAATFVTHICGQIQIQIVRLQNLIDEGQDKDAFHQQMATIVSNHVEILRFSKDVEKALREVCLIEIVESTLIICLLEYYCLTEWQKSDAVAILTYFMLLTSFTFNVLIYCYVGEILSEQCSRVGPASYNVYWYNLPAKKAYNLILLNAVSLYPPKLTAGKIIQLSFTTFSAVVKTSVMYLNLLRTVTTW